MNKISEYNVFHWIGGAASTYIVVVALIVIWNIVRRTEEKTQSIWFTYGFLAAYGVLTVSNWFDNTSTTFGRWTLTAIFAIMVSVHLYFWIEGRRFRKDRERALARAQEIEDAEETWQPSPTDRRPPGTPQA